MYHQQRVLHALRHQVVQQKLDLSSGWEYVKPSAAAIQTHWAVEFVCLTYP